jgi:hydroxymethylpyrimidine pyrophosphatase-like HAD family hydrolase
VSVVTELAGRIRQSSNLAGLGWESATGIGYDEQFIASSPQPDALERGGSADLLGQQPLYKLYIRTPGLVRGELPQALLKLMGDLAELTTSGASFVEATAQGVNKASGLAALAKALNFSAADTIAFGDNLNDLPMLNWAATSVAMANAHPDVLATTAIKTLSNAQDGVAVKIEQILAGT